MTDPEILFGVLYIIWIFLIGFAIYAEELEDD